MKENDPASSFHGSPDESGWYFFKKNRRSSAYAVFVNDEGVGLFMSENGDNGSLDDLVGEWIKIDDELL